MSAQPQYVDGPGGRALRLPPEDRKRITAEVATIEAWLAMPRRMRREQGCRDSATTLRNERDARLEILEANE